MTDVIEINHNVEAAKEMIGKEDNVAQAKLFSQLSNSYDQEKPNPFADMEFQQPLRGVNKIVQTKENQFNVGVNINKK